MREGLITIPKKDNNGKPLDDLIEVTLRMFAKKFGGATAIEAQGAWIGPDGKLYREPVMQIITAYDPSDRSGDEFLWNTSANAGLGTGQLAMYVRYASGEVEIIELKDAQIAA